MKKNVLLRFLTFSFALSLLLASSAFAQSDCVNYGTAAQMSSWNPVWNFTNLKQSKRSNLTIGPSGIFNGLLEYLPASYSAPGNQNKKFPVIIFFHGYGSRGNGSAADLCRLFKDRGGDLATHLSIPGRVERNTNLFSQSTGETTQEFVVISPQFNIYDRHEDGTGIYPSFNEVEDVIDYVEAHYRIDKRRIYLTGLSNGANMILEYAASSLARAKRVAAIMPVALCSQMNHISNTSRHLDAKYIGQAKLKTWFVYCQTDNCGSGPQLKVSNDWVKAIKAVPGAEPPRLTILKTKTTTKPLLYDCSDTLAHDAWSRAFNPDFKASFTYNANFDIASAQNDDNNQNIYQWFAQSTNVVLPVELKEFTARLINKRVELKWITTDEKNNASFTIERAGPDQKFTAIATIPGAVDSKGERTYTYTDGSPLANLSFYRLVQTDIDGKQTYFDIRKILNQVGVASSVVISPNPFTSDISAFVTVDKAQKVFVSLADLNGRILKTSTGIYSPGSSEIKINSNGLPKGVYLLKVSGENFNISKKVIKN
ncbi:MAG: T9SS type A sorting domain-containing protein [Chitinophagaceae bacterium]|nr:T9SS type A sorting domain-containing protein [Chitinophagaceae bacterium]